jgi:hypothetical protein
LSCFKYHGLLRSQVGSSYTVDSTIKNSSVKPPIDFPAKRFALAKLRG